MAGYIGSKAVNLSTTGADINGNANIDGDLSFGDNNKAIFGAGSDLQIYHNGSDSFIDDAGTGSLYMRSNSVVLGKYTGEVGLVATADGSVDLYYNDVKKLATTSTGIDVTGSISADGLTVDASTTVIQKTGDSPTLQFKGHAGSQNTIGEIQSGRAEFSGTNSFMRFKTNDGTSTKTRLNIDANGDISFYEDTGTTAKFFWDASAERLFVGDNTTNMPSAVTGAGLMVTGTSPTGADGGQLVIKSSELTSDAGNGGGLVFDNYNGVGNRVFGAIQVLKENSTSNNNDSYMRFTTRSNSSGLAERMRIDSSGNLLKNTTSTISTGSNSDTGIQLGANNQAIFMASGGPAVLIARNGSTGEVVRFGNQGTGDVGSIDVTTSSTSYNTSSDHRLKENVVELTGATTRLKQLNPSRFNFIADADTTVDGFIAHEVQSVVPEAITGTHNEVDADGNPVYQGIDQSKLVPLLTAALQEALDEITDLKARVATLEAN